jgi:hypothetical protein
MRDDERLHVRLLSPGEQSLGVSRQILWDDSECDDGLFLALVECSGIGRPSFEQEQRRLAAILAADMAGYSRLVALRGRMLQNDSTTADLVEACPAKSRNRYPCLKGAFS